MIYNQHTNCSNRQFEGITPYLCGAADKCFSLKLTSTVTKLTFLNLHRENIHLLYSLLQLILCRCCNWIHIIVAPIIILIGEGTEDLCC